MTEGSVNDAPEKKSSTFAESSAESFKHVITDPEVQSALMLFAYCMKEGRQDFNLADLVHGNDLTLTNAAINWWISAGVGETCFSKLFRIYASEHPDEVIDTLSQDDLRALFKRISPVRH